MLRLIAATTRMALDTEVLLDVARTAAVAEQEPTPDPWPANQGAVTAEVAYPPKIKTTSPAWRGALCYRGNFAPAGIMSSHGPALGAGVRLGLVDLVLEVGMLIGPILRVEDMEARPLRLPVRLGGGIAWTLGRLEIVPGLRLLPEPVWMDVRLVQVGGDGEQLEPRLRARRDAMSAWLNLKEAIALLFAMQGCQPVVELGPASAAPDTRATDSLDDTSLPSDWSSVSDTAPTTDTTTNEPPTGCTAMDILFIIDDSHSMSCEQESLGLSFPRFIEVLEQYSNEAASEVSWRVGVTTTGVSSGKAPSLWS